MPIGKYNREYLEEKVIHVMISQQIYLSKAVRETVWHITAVWGGPNSILWFPLANIQCFDKVADGDMHSSSPFWYAKPPSVMKVERL